MAYDCIKNNATINKAVFVRMFATMKSNLIIPPVAKTLMVWNVLINIERWSETKVHDHTSMIALNLMNVT